MRGRKALFAAAGAALMAGVGFVWSTPFLWMIVAALRPEGYGPAELASLAPDFVPTLENFRLAWESADFLVNYANTLIVVCGILGVQLVTVTLAGYAFARLEFRFKEALFYLFLLQLMLVPPILIIPNLTTAVRLGIYDTLIGVMAPYMASAFGTFLMRQAFRAVPRDFEDAAVIDGCSFLALLRHVMLPLVRPTLVAFAIVSVVAHWNELLWPLMVVNSPKRQTLVVGLASFTQASEGAAEWGLIAAGTLLVTLPLILAFIAFQRQFVNSFMFSGLK
ncbi:MAG TPA: carbohydrate ABC transporter permease [Alphaproteobacteria bacterium]|nr:carbohydrate ABC transporter permease [Alphaproteobacteria bacterium]